MDEGESETTTPAAAVEEFMAGASGSQSMRAYLVVLAGSNVGAMYKIDGGELLIGRAKTVNVRLDDDGVSRRHARVVQKDGEVVIEDCQSANGTFVNGSRVVACTLKDGDKIRIGATTILKFSYHDRLDETFQKQMYEAALRDGLTKTFNRRYLLDRLQTEFAYSRRHGTALSLLLLDIDHFKKVNDGYGHLAGDHVLASVARCLQTALRTEDVLARYGGEEFVIICRGIALQNAALLGERLRELVKNTPIDVEGQCIAVTVSVGISALPDPSVASSEQLVASADEALYEAKRAGRDRVRVRGPNGQGENPRSA